MRSKGGENTRLSIVSLPSDAAAAAGDLKGNKDDEEEVKNIAEATRQSLAAVNKENFLDESFEK